MICFDTPLLTWGVQATAQTQQTNMIGRMEAYLRFLQKERIRIMVPTPVVFEYLIPFEQRERAKELERLERLFIIPPFDLRASLIAADLMGNQDAIAAAREQGRRRQEVRIDAQIVAVALANGAIISPDSHVKTIAQGRIPVEEVPVIVEQGEMDLPEGN